MERFIKLNSSKQTPSLKQTGILFSIVMLLLLVVGAWAQHREIYSGLLITEYALILGPCLLLLCIYKFNLKETLRLNRLRLLNIILIILIMITAIPIVGILNLINLTLIQAIFGKILVVQPPTAQSSVELLFSLFIIAITPAICEEILFRGLIQKSYYRFGAKRAILLTAILFGLFHMDFQKFLGTFLLGALIGYIVHRTNSLYAGILAHFTNNACGVIIAYSINKAQSLMDPGNLLDTGQDLDFSLFAGLPTGQIIAVIVVWLIAFIFFVVAFAALLYVFYINTKEQQVEYPRSENPGYKKLWWLTPGITLIVAFYLLQGLTMSGKVIL